MNNLHFIVGMSRSGTTWMMSSLNRHSLLTSFGETSFFGRYGIHKNILTKDDLDKLWKVYSQINISYNNPTEAAFNSGGAYTVMSDVIEEIIKEKVNTVERKVVFDRFIDRMLSIEGKKIAIEKTPHHLNYIEDIRTMYPDSKIIVMKRDAKSFMLSYKHQGDRKDAVVKSIFEMIYHPVGCCFVYRKYNNSIKKAMSFPNTFLVNFPEIREKPKEIITEVFDFLSVPYEDTLKAKINSSFPNGEKKELQTADKFWLWFFGYEKIKLSIVEMLLLPFYILHSLFLLPIWSFRVIKYYNKTMKGGVIRYFWNILKG